MQNLHTASRELFRRMPDETFSSVADLSAHCQWQRANSDVLWRSASEFRAMSVDSKALVLAETEDLFLPMNDWSFGQLCRLSGVEKRTINRLTAETASRVFQETMPRGNRPLQIYQIDEQIHSIHGTSYTRLHNAEVLDAVLDAADGFDAPPKGVTGGTGLYCGEQDLFCFLIDPTGWVEIDGENFAPGFFVWNSEVGCRSVGIQTFWYQQICQNHIVWDAVEVFDLTRKHTTNVHEGLEEIRHAIQRLVAKRDARRDQFAKIIAQAMQERFADEEEAQKAVLATGVGQRMARRAVERAMAEGRLTIFSLVDALTRFAGEQVNAGDRAKIDQQAGTLLNLAV